jgi:hypothetical protein
MANELRKLKEEIKDLKNKLETETNARNQAEMELDNQMRRLSSQEGEFKNKHLSTVKELAQMTENKKKMEMQMAANVKKISELETVNRSQAVKMKEMEKKLNSAYRLSTQNCSSFEILLEITVEKVSEIVLEILWQYCSNRS